MAAYSMTQYISVLLLYEIDSNLSDFEFLYIDLFLITIFAFFFGLTKAHEGMINSVSYIKYVIKKIINDLVSFFNQVSFII